MRNVLPPEKDGDIRHEQRLNRTRHSANRPTRRFNRHLFAADLSSVSTKQTAARRNVSIELRLCRLTISHQKERATRMIFADRIEHLVNPCAVIRDGGIDEQVQSARARHARLRTLRFIGRLPHRRQLFLNLADINAFGCGDLNCVFLCLHLHDYMKASFNLASSSFQSS